MAQSAQIIHPPIQNLSASPVLSPLKSLNSFKSKVMKSIYFMYETILLHCFFYKLAGISSAFRFLRSKRQ